MFTSRKRQLALEVAAQDTINEAVREYRTHMRRYLDIKNDLAITPGTFSHIVNSVQRITESETLTNHPGFERFPQILEALQDIQERNSNNTPIPAEVVTAVKNCLTHVGEEQYKFLATLNALISTHYAANSNLIRSYDHVMSIIHKHYNGTKAPKQLTATHRNAYIAALPNKKFPRAHQAIITNVEQAEASGTFTEDELTRYTAYLINDFVARLTTA